MGPHDCGGLIKNIGASKNMVKAPGEWNAMRVELQGSEIKVSLNGEQIINGDLAKTPNAKDHPLGGHIAFQDHGQEVWFRNIRLLDLAAE